jgi:hypothetical protein
MIAVKPLKRSRNVAFRSFVVIRTPTHVPRVPLLWAFDLIVGGVRRRNLSLGEKSKYGWHLARRTIIKVIIDTIYGYSFKGLRD